MNVQSFLRNWAVRLNSDDWDAWGANRGKNCYLFRPAEEGRWYLIPWDMELTYGNVDAFPHPTGASGAFAFSFGEVNRLLNRPRLRRYYYGILKEMVDGPFSSSYLGPYMSRLRSLGFTNTVPGEAGQFVDQRNGRITTWINSVVAGQVGFLITSPNNGGPTATHALLPGSPAINAGPNGTPATDQRGIAYVGAPDLGAFESRGFTLAVSGGGDQTAPLNAAFASPLRVTLSSQVTNFPRCRSNCSGRRHTRRNTSCVTSSATCVSPTTRRATEYTRSP